MSGYIGNRVGYAVTSAQNNGGRFNLITQFNSTKRGEWLIPLSNTTGGTVIASAPNGYRYHIFTSSGTLNLGVGTTADILIIAGGGGGQGTYYTGGGGAGGAVIGRAVPLAAGSAFSVVVGTGGIGGLAGDPGGAPGTPSSFNSVTAIGGGAGGVFLNPPDGLYYGAPGGSGGGGGAGASGGGSAVPQPVPAAYTAYGNPGGVYGAGTGGGAGAPGVPGVGYGRTFYGFEGPIVSPVFPAGLQPQINDPLGVGVTGRWAGGGQGGTYSGGPTSQAIAIVGGGGQAGGPGNPGTPGLQYTGSGGGGGSGYGGYTPGGNGAPGIVIVRFIP